MLKPDWPLDPLPLLYKKNQKTKKKTDGYCRIMIIELSSCSATVFGDGFVISL